MRAKEKSYHHGDLRIAVEKIAWAKVVSDGADKLSLRACARAANVDPAAVYRHFKSKDDILMALTQRAFQELSAEMQKDADQADMLTAKEIVMKVGLTYVNYATRNPNVFSMMFDVAGKKQEDMGQIGGGNKNAYEILQDSLRAWLKDIDDPSLETISFALWSNVHGLSELFNRGFGPQSKAERAARARAVCAIALDGCKTALQQQP